MKKLLIAALLAFIAILAIPWLLQAWVKWRTQPNIYPSGTDVPPVDVALVLGAGLWRDGSPTPVLYDRVATAVELHQAGRVKKLLLSGDNSFENYNEPAAMRRLALELGMPDQDIVLDYAGRRTYDSCYRARDIFEVDQLIVVTQEFHLNRALYICKALNINAIGVVADKRPYRNSWQRFWQLREVAALVRAWLDVNILQPQPILGDKIPIEIANTEHQ